MAEVWLKSDILLKNLIYKVRLVKSEISEVRKVDLHGSLLVLLDQISLLDVETDRPALDFLAVGVKLVVWIVFTQLKPTWLDA